MREKKSKKEQREREERERERRERGEREREIIPGAEGNPASPWLCP